jgi:hypothetical protein
MGLIKPLLRMYQAGLHVSDMHYQPEVIKDVL